MKPTDELAWKTAKYDVAMLNTPAKRLTYRVLTWQGDAGFMGIK